MESPKDRVETSTMPRDIPYCAGSSTATPTARTPAAIERMRLGFICNRVFVIWIALCEPVPESDDVYACDAVESFPVHPVLDVPVLDVVVDCLPAYLQDVGRLLDGEEVGFGNLWFSADHVTVVFALTAPMP